MLWKTCPVCGLRFRPGRRDAIFDTDTCRQKSHREGKRLERYKDDAIDIIEAMETWTSHQIHGKDAMDYLEAIFYHAAAHLARAQGVKQIDSDWWLVFDKNKQLKIVALSEKEENRSHTD